MAETHRTGTRSRWTSSSLGLVIGLAIGVALGASLHNIGEGIAIGVAIGVALSVAFEAGGSRGPRGSEDQPSDPASGEHRSPSS
ncbi:hypothetical protein [uncultured Leifsonia sp.]|uniref:hypothetical protein n=1 Tax=uncultured Leifsonia sp. TaxID=340359 RepID=UPI0025DD1282|nr:hypothetical protein [uncultured Leifsonia sp.]